MYLAVLDISQYSNDDHLPIPAGMENEIVEKVYAKFVSIVPESGIVDNYNTTKVK